MSTFQEAGLQTHEPTAALPASRGTPRGYTQSKRLEPLDSVRGLACLAVLLGHSIGIFAWPGGSPRWVLFPFLNILFDGRSAVTMFFVLSGFVLARPYLDSAAGQPRRRLFVPTFYLRRWTRIWFPWLFAFSLSAAFKELFFVPHSTIPPVSEWTLRFWHGPLTLSSVLGQCAFVLHDPRQLLLPQDWSVGVELKGSALIPIFVFLARRRFCLLYLMLTAGLLLTCVRTGTGMYYVSFIVGVATARYHGAIDGRLRRVKFGWKCTLLLLGLLLYQSRLLGFYLHADRESLAWCVASVGCALVLALCLCSRRIGAALSRKELVLLGKISYSVFLLQFIVLLGLLPPLIQLLNATGITQSWAVMAITLLFGTAATIGLSVLTFRWVEAPCIRLGQWLTASVQRISLFPKR